jgi:hypothetical protein
VGSFHSTDGINWTDAGLGKLGASSIYVAASDAVYAADPDIRRSNGTTTWVSTPLAGLVVNTVGGSGPTDLWASGMDAKTNEIVLFHSTGNNDWSPQRTGIKSLASRQAIGAVSPAGIYVLYGCHILRSSGDGQWTTVFLSTDDACGLQSIYAAPNGEVYVATGDHTVLHKR